MSAPVHDCGKAVPSVPGAFLVRGAFTEEDIRVLPVLSPAKKCPPSFDATATCALYANDDCEGGHTTFFEPEAFLPASNKKLTPQCDRESLRVAAAIQPRAGDALVFPHGLHPGCHPSPLHEGSEVLRGEKLLVRTDIMFRVPHALNVGVAAKARPVKDMVEGPLPSAGLIPAAQGEDGHDDESSPIEVSPSATREDGDEDDATLSDDEAEDGGDSEEELVSRPQPTFVPGKIKVMQRRQAEGEEVPKSSGDESEPTAAKIDPSRLPLEERERYYLQARARIFGESGKAPETPEVDAEDAPVVEDPQTVQRRAARELKLAQEKSHGLSRVLLDGWDSVCDRGASQAGMVLR
ncbi:hypothetical protein AK812_SmicGene9399 [Symbiodinium microadriaticum]|uniref:SUZ domain-containing protein n=1 Tax=Symbiodinium microadriaticum TaxID=2951 RepID=A0A1Q9EIG2_SYMMI|nr:hypothetical protein AK812_SmicGene9399 [Symbiodinium microadriaticum]